MLRRLGALLTLALLAGVPGPPAAPSGPADGRLTIPRLGITDAPIWSRGYALTAEGALAMAVVPRWGVTRFAPSAPLGAPGLSLLYGSANRWNGVFRFLGSVQGPRPRERPHPFPGDEVQVHSRGHFWRYYVRHVFVMGLRDLGPLNRPWRRPTLALLTQTKAQRILVIAQIR